MRTILPYKLYFMLRPHHVISSFARHSNSSVVKLSLLFNLFYIYIYIYTSIDLDFNTRNDNIKNQYNFAVYSVLFSFIHYIRYAKSSCIDYRVSCFSCISIHERSMHARRLVSKNITRKFRKHTNPRNNVGQCSIHEAWINNSLPYCM